MRRLAGILCLAAAAYFLLPLTLGVAHVGIAAPAAVLLCAAFFLLAPKAWRRLPRWLRTAALGCLALGLAAALVLTALMIHAARRVPPAGAAGSTVVVLGCQVNGRSPSLMLLGRIDAAAGCLAAWPDSPCVCSGGQGGGAAVSEAECIASVLIQRGVDPGRIYREARSASTAENLRFSAAVIRENGLPDTVIIASDAFHQYRAAWFARQNGLTPYAAACRTPWFLAGGYWCREMAAILVMYVRGY